MNFVKSLIAFSFLFSATPSLACTWHMESKDYKDPRVTHWHADLKPYESYNIPREMTGPELACFLTPEMPNGLTKIRYLSCTNPGKPVNSTYALKAYSDQATTLVPFLGAKELPSVYIVCDNKL